MFLAKGLKAANTWTVVTYTDDELHEAKDRMVLASVKESVREQLGASNFTQGDFTSFAVPRTVLIRTVSQTCTPVATLTCSRLSCLPSKTLQPFYQLQSRWQQMCSDKKLAQQRMVQLVGVRCHFKALLRYFRL